MGFIVGLSTKMITFVPTNRASREMLPTGLREIIVIIGYGT